MKHGIHKNDRCKASNSCLLIDNNENITSEEISTF